MPTVSKTILQQLNVEAPVFALNLQPFLNTGHVIGKVSTRSVDTFVLYFMYKFSVTFGYLFYIKALPTLPKIGSRRNYEI